jgi:capsular exopolysaccharide synthesis family protein
MSGGQIVANPLELISSPKFKQLLDKLSEVYDQIIIDTPPTQTVSDSLIIGSMADAVVYVVKADSTPINIIKTGITRLRYANANVIGVTLNQVDTEKQSSYYYGGYYDSYGYSKKNASTA